MCFTEAQIEEDYVMTDEILNAEEGNPVFMTIAILNKSLQLGFEMESYSYI